MNMFIRRVTESKKGKSKLAALRNVEVTFYAKVR